MTRRGVSSAATGHITLRTRATRPTPNESTMRPHRTGSGFSSRSPGPPRLPSHGNMNGKCGTAWDDSRNGSAARVGIPPCSNACANFHPRRGTPCPLPLATPSTLRVAPRSANFAAALLLTLHSVGRTRTPPVWPAEKGVGGSGGTKTTTGCLRRRGVLPTPTGFFFGAACERRAREKDRLTVPAGAHHTRRCVRRDRLRERPCPRPVRHLTRLSSPFVPRRGPVTRPPLARRLSATTASSRSGTETERLVRSASKLERRHIAPNWPVGALRRCDSLASTIGFSV